MPDHLSRIKTQHGLQDQRRADVGINRRMGAGEHFGQALVGNVSLLRCHGIEFLGQELQMTHRCFAAAPAPHAINDLALGHRHQPGFRTCRNSLARPVGQRRGEGLGQGILGSHHIARLLGQIGYQPAVVAPRNFLRRILCKLAAIHPCIAMTGRTSTVPYWAPGHFAAQPSAASRSFTSMM